MIAFSLTNLKEFMSQLLLSETFDSFAFIEGEIVTFNTFRIDGFLQKEFFDTEEPLPEYSLWKNVRDYCFSLIRGKRTPLSFRFVFSLSRKNIEKLTAQNVPSLDPDAVQGLYLNIHYDGARPTVLQQHMFVYSLKAFCMAAYKLFLFLKFCRFLLAFYGVLWYNKYYMKRSTYYVS